MYRRAVPATGAAPSGPGISAGTAQSGGAQERLATGGAGGDATPDGVQRLLYNYRADLVRDDLVVGVVRNQRQYSGTAGRIENCQVGVFLAYAGVKGRTLLDRELYLPQVWVRDWERGRSAVGFRTKPQLAQFMLGRTLESGVPFAWFNHEVYGSDRNLRLWLEREEIAHVMAIKSNEKLWALTDRGPLQVRADRLAAGVDCDVHRVNTLLARPSGSARRGPHGLGRCPGSGHRSCAAPQHAAPPDGP